VALWPSWLSGSHGSLNLLALWPSLALWPCWLSEPSGLLAFWPPSYPTIESSPFRGDGVADPGVSLEHPGGVSCSGRWAGPGLAPHWARHAPTHHARSSLHWGWGGLFLFATLDEKGGVRGGAPAPGGRKFYDVYSRLARVFICSLSLLATLRVSSALVLSSLGLCRYLAVALVMVFLVFL
jgi:hypothetical protein